MFVTISCDGVDGDIHLLLVHEGVWHVHSANMLHEEIFSVELLGLVAWLGWCATSQETLPVCGEEMLGGYVSLPFIL